MLFLYQTFLSQDSCSTSHSLSPPPFHLWLHSTCAWVLLGTSKITLSRPGMEGKGLLFSYTSFSYKPATTTPVAPTNHFSLLKDSVWQLQSAEISAGKIINQTSCVGPCFWSFPIEQSSVTVSFFPLKPHIPCPVQFMLLIPVLSTLILCSFIRAGSNSSSFHSVLVIQVLKGPFQ